MLTRILHRLVAIPWIYDLSQVVAGVRFVHGRMAPHLQKLDSARAIVDLGGGTGTLRYMFPATSSYLCLDIDRVKLSGYLSKHPDGHAILCSGASMPVASESVDAALLVFVSHHLPEDVLEQVIAECARVLKPTGVFIFMDPIWVPTRKLGRLLWSLDRGSYPRTEEVLYKAVARQFAITVQERFAVYHEYIFCLGIKRRDSDNPSLN